ncbi:MAG: DUF3108 domain-containing protein, partial [Acidovorax sp.]|nr:DUF3108 domain-containing protein [Acidovorax sp.]
MPRRTLFLITAIVLALHWLVLGGVSLGWDHAPQPAGKVFSTRSIAAAPPASPPPAAPAAQISAPAPQRPSPRHSAKPSP